MGDITEEAYTASTNLLRKVSTEKGFTASCVRVANYKRVFSRDGIISGIAALSTEDEKLINTFKDTLKTLKDNQDETGRIPSNVSLNGGSVSYGTIVGRIDATIWYVIGVSQYVLKTGDRKLLKDFRISLDNAVFYLKCAELNGRGLLYVPMGGDWADEYINQGYVLFDQLLYLFALRNYHALTHDESTCEKIKRLEKLILINYFPDEKNINSKYVYHKRLFETGIRDYSPPLPLAYFFTNQTIHHHVDNFANSLLLFSGLLTEEENQRIRERVLARCTPKNFPILPPFYPVIQRGEEGWRRLRGNYLYEFRNKPYEYQNGGLWPLIHGFFISSMGSAGVKHLEKFAMTLKDDGFTFPEFYHGKTFKPMGTKNLGFSAAAYIIAHDSIKKGLRPLL